MVEEAGYGELEDLGEALCSLGAAVTFHPADWAQHSRDAWIYGIVNGWDDPDRQPDEPDTMAELQERHGWSDDDVRRLRRYHRAFREGEMWGREAFRALMRAKDAEGRARGGFVPGGPDQPSASLYPPVESVVDTRPLVCGQPECWGTPAWERVEHGERREVFCHAHATLRGTAYLIQIPGSILPGHGPA